MKGRALRTLRGRIALAIIAGVLTAAVVFAIVAASLLRAQAEAVARAELDRQVAAIALLLGRQTTASAIGGQPLRVDSAEYLNVIGGPDAGLFYSGNPLTPAAGQPGNAIPSSVVLDTNEIGSAGIQRVEFVDPVNGGNRVGSIAPVPVRGETWGFLLLARAPNELATAWGGVAGRVAFAALVGATLALALALALTGRLTRPLRAMQAATHRVAGGNLRTQLGPTGIRELDELVGDFNQMVRQLAEREGASRDFLMRITHDLRTPLTAIRGHAAALADGVVPDRDRPRSLQAIENEAERLEAMVSDLLDLARLEARRFRLATAPASPRAIVERALESVRVTAAERGVDLVANIEPSESAVVTDELRALQIVSNLLENAVRWTPADGVVTVTLQRPGGGVRLTVTDTGPGIPAARREDIFTPFTAFDRPDGSRGSGLGLAISRELARALGGDLLAVDHPGGGRFVLTLPAGTPVPNTIL